MRVAVYARVSTTDKGQTVENQFFDIRRACELKDWTIVLEKQDAISGAKSKRPGLTAIMEAADRKEFDVLVVWSLDRLTREGALRALEIVQKLSSLGIGFHSLKEPIFDTTGPLKDMIIAIWATVATLERERIGERIRTSLKRKKAEGVKLGRPQKISESKVLEMSSKGMTVPDIQKEIGAGKSRIYEIIKRGA